MKQITDDNFILLLNTDSEEKYVRVLFTFIKKIFINEFGNGLLSSERCMVYNDSNAPCPMLITNSSPIVIRTCAVSLEYWAQYIYQLSHELTHYVIRQKKDDKDNILRWFEETLCEAMSLHILKVASEQWDECGLSDLDPGYNIWIQDYLQNEYNDIASFGLRNCTTLEELQQIENECQKQRQERISERNYLYELFNKYTSEISVICNYTKYIKDNKLLIDFKKWALEEPTHVEFINSLSKIQPSIES